MSRAWFVDTSREFGDYRTRAWQRVIRGPRPNVGEVTCNPSVSSIVEADASKEVVCTTTHEARGSMVSVIIGGLFQDQKSMSCGRC